MRIIDTIYIDGAFVTPHGDDRVPLFNPATEKQIGEVRLDAFLERRAILSRAAVFGDRDRQGD